MKKLSTIAVVAIFGALTFTSCKKNYTCTCKIHVGADTSMGMSAWDTTITHDLGKQKKSDAKSACDKDQSDLNMVFGDGTANCGI